VTFQDTDLARIAAAEEIEIETRSAEGQAHRTIIWAVVTDGVIRVRSVNGPGARWYREATADPNVAIHLDGQRWPARAISATGPDDVEACNEGLRQKYAHDGSLRAMLAPTILDTTLRLEPA
jgi:hypothetical protein